MARPKGRNGKSRKFYLADKVYNAATRLAFSRNLSASQLVSELLRREIERADRKAKAA